MSAIENATPRTAQSLSKNSVDSVDSTASTSPTSPESQGSKAGDTGLVSPALPVADFVDSGASGADVDPASATSLASDPYSPGGKWHKFEEVKGRCFDILQYETHPTTGAVLITRKRIEKAVAKRPNDKYSWVYHDKDEYTEDDLARNPRAVLGQIKPPHFHIAETRKSEASVGQVARAYGVPPTFVSAKPQSAFLDLIVYQTHEHPKQQALDKHLYLDSEIHANFDFRAAITKRAARHSRGSTTDTKMTDIDRLAMAIQEDGMTLREARETDPLAFNRAASRMEKSRAIYLRHLPPPPHRICFYFEGEGGVGKDLLAKALARTLVPGDWIPGVLEPFFSIGGDNVAWEGYDGQPVVIFEEARVANLIQSMGRKELYTFMNPFPEKQLLNVKNSSTQPINTITIFTGPDPYDKFLDGLAGEYIDKAGTPHKAENKPQIRRRVPFIIPVREDSFDLLVNKGFADNTREFSEYYKYLNIRQSIEQVRIRVKGITDTQRRIETHLAIEATQVAPITEQYHRVLEAKATKDEDPDALLAEFANLGQTLSPVELAARANKADRAHEERMLAIATRHGARYLAHFSQAHLDGVNTPDPTPLFICSGCTATTVPLKIVA